MDNSILYILPLLTNLGSSLGDEWSWRKLLPLLVTCLVPVFIHGPMLLIQWKRWLTDVWSDMRGTRLQFVARQQIRRWFDDPDSIVRNFSIVMWDWNSRNEIIGTLHVSEEANALHNRYYDDDSIPGTHNNSPLFIDNANKPFWRISSSNIQYTMWVERSTDREGNNMSEIILKIEYFGLTASHMVEHIEWIRTEASRIQEQRKKKQRVFVTSSESEKDEAQFMSYEFHTTSSFTNFFCEEANIVKTDLEHFLNHRDEYTRIGRPWTYTVLNSGPPGVGKTKLVKSLAAHTNYTVIVINLNHITSMKMLYNIFHSSILAGEKIPHDQRLYYIPEVDTQVHNVLNSRENNVEIPVVPAKKETENGIAVIGSTTKRPTLGEILNVLDGVPERHGHILILDTNHIDTLDKALIRPGRVDRILRWGAMSATSLRDYLENYYRCSVKMPLADCVHTAAEVGAIVAEEKTVDGACKRLGPNIRTGRMRQAKAH